MFIRDPKVVFTPFQAIAQQVGVENAPDPQQVERERHMRRAERFGVEFQEPPQVGTLGQVKRYTNPFLLAQEKAKKMEERGLRFGLIDPEEKAKKERRQQKFGPLVPPSTTTTDESESKGLDLNDEGEQEEKEEKEQEGGMDEEEGGMELETREPKKEWPVEVKRRPDTLYVYGTDKMSTEDVFQYFGLEYRPQFVEWIDDSSCNVVFADPSSAAQAFMNVSNPTESDGLVPPPGEPVELYAWRTGKQPWRTHAILLRFATIEDRRPLVPKKSAYIEEMLRQRKAHKQRNTQRGPSIKVSISKERQQLQTQNKKHKNERRRRRGGGGGGKEGDAGDAQRSQLQKAIISTLGLEEVADDDTRRKRGLKFGSRAQVAGGGEQPESRAHEQQQQQPPPRPQQDELL